MKDVVIAGAARTPMGGFQGMYDGVTAAELGGAAIRAALSGAGAGSVDEVLMGCVLPAGQGQAPARQAGFAGGLGKEVPATTLNKMCGSGMKAAMMAFDQIALGHADVMIAGGAEGAVCRLGVAGFAAARALTTGYNDRPSEASRPWDEGRDGFAPRRLTASPAPPRRQGRTPLYRRHR